MPCFSAIFLKVPKWTRYSGQSTTLSSEKLYSAPKMGTTPGGGDDDAASPLVGAAWGEGEEEEKEEQREEQRKEREINS